MILELQYKIKNNSNYLKYIRENSNWYKILNREPNRFIEFENEVKTNYKLRATDKIEKAIDTFDLLQNIFMSFK